MRRDGRSRPLPTICAHPPRAGRCDGDSDYPRSRRESVTGTRRRLRPSRRGLLLHGTTPACCDFVSDGWCVIDALSLTWSMTWDLDGAEIMRRMGFEGDACTGPTTGSASGTMADNSDNCDVHGGVRQTFDGGD